MQIFDINENDANQRLDKFLKKLFPKATRSLIYKLNRKWKIKISQDGKIFHKKDNEYKIQKWEKVKIFLSDKDIQILREEEKREEMQKKERFQEQDIVYQDGDILVVNKSSWINVHPWDHKTNEISLIHLVQDYLWEKLNSLTFRPSLVHRIDRDTSWIVIIAKKKEALSSLVNDFKTHENIKKIYYALVIWKMPQKKWKIEKRLERIENAKNENKVKVSEKWKEAITLYEVIWEKEMKTEKWIIIISELKIEIKTGRMHQIRVHLADNNTPILWDKTYGDKSLNYYVCQKYGLCRQALHAWQIEFLHPIKKKKVFLEARLKDDMKKFLDNL